MLVFFLLVFFLVDEPVAVLALDPPALGVVLDDDEVAVDELSLGSSAGLSSAGLSSAGLSSAGLLLSSLVLWPLLERELLRDF